MISYLLNLSTYNPEKKNVARAIKIFKNISSKKIFENLNKTRIKIYVVLLMRLKIIFDIKEEQFLKFERVFAKMQDELKNEGRQELYSCKFSRWKRNFGGFEAGAFDPNVLRCSSSQDFIALI